jgi:hypothetical protein
MGEAKLGGASRTGQKCQSTVASEASFKSLSPLLKRPFCLDRSTGEAFAEFNSTGDARRALEKNKQMIGARYVELFPSSREEATRAATSRI